jgi:hypothetical protein
MVCSAIGWRLEARKRLTANVFCLKPIAPPGHSTAIIETGTVLIRHFILMFDCAILNH